MKPRRDKHAPSAAAHAAPARQAPPVRQAPPTWQERLQSVIAVLAIALALASTLTPSEGAIHAGIFAILATCWCLLLVGWAALAFSTPGCSIRWGWTELAGAAFVVWHSLAAVVWLGRGNDRQTLNALWLIVGYGLTVFLLRQVIDSPRRSRMLISLFLWLAATLAATGYVEYFVTRPAQRVAYQKDPDTVLREQRVSTDPASPERMLFENRLLSVEPLATFALTNSLAGFLAPWLIVALAIGLAVLREPGLRRSLVGAALIAALLAGCLLMTKSRTAVLATLAGLALLAIYGRRGGWRMDWRWPAIATAAAIVIGLGVAYAGGLDVEVLSEAPKSVLYRLEYWRSTADLIAEHPLWGCGPGNFQETYAAYKLPQASEMVADPHNFLLEVWATAGTPGVALLLAAFAALAFDLVRLSAVRPANSSMEPTNAAVSRNGIATLYSGSGIAGLVLGYLLAALNLIPLNTLGDMAVPVIWWVGMPLLALVWWLLGPWVERGELPVGAVVVALLVLGINLLAAGAVVFPGVIVTALVLMPIVMQLGVSHVAVRSTEPPPTARAWWVRLPGDMRLSRAVAGAICAAAFALAILCLWTEYQPVLNSRLQMDSALHHLQSGEPAAARKALTAAAVADPWSPEPWRVLADQQLHRFMSEPSEAAWSEFTAAADEFRRRNPRHHRQLFQRGNWFFLAWQCSDHRVRVLTPEGRGLGAKRPAMLAEALAAYGEAIHRYPNHALYHGQLAWALHAAGQPAAARESAERATALDDAMPHSDQKLARSQITDWQSTQEGVQRTRRPETAELTVKSLRTTNGN